MTAPRFARRHRLALVADAHRPVLPPQQIRVVLNIPPDTPRVNLGEWVDQFCPWCRTLHPPALLCPMRR